MPEDCGSNSEPGVGDGGGNPPVAGWFDFTDSGGDLADVRLLTDVNLGNLNDNVDVPLTGPLLMSSPGGAAWNARPPGTNRLRATAFGNGTFVAAGDNGSRIARRFTLPANALIMDMDRPLTS